MKKNGKQEVVIVTMTKSKFEKLSKDKQRVVVAQDVLDRIALKQIIPNGGSFCTINDNNGEHYDDDIQVSEILKKPKTTCYACAKGGLFLAYIGIVNNYSGDVFGYGYFRDSQELDSEEMKKLSKIFTPKQLSLIETTFEHKSYDWNTPLTTQEEEKCFDFHKKYGYKKGENEFNTYSDKTKVLKAICNNIIKNEGTFTL
jgi:hypothetical protein